MGLRKRVVVKKKKRKQRKGKETDPPGLLITGLLEFVEFSLLRIKCLLKGLKFEIYREEDKKKNCGKPKVTVRNFFRSLSTIPLDIVFLAIF